MSLVNLFLSVRLGVIVGFSQLLYTVGEGDGNISVHVHKSGQNRASVTVQLSTRDDSAIGLKNAYAHA